MTKFVDWLWWKAHFGVRGPVKMYAVLFVCHMILVSIVCFCWTCFHKCKMKIKTFDGRDCQFSQYLFFSSSFNIRITWILAGMSAYHKDKFPTFLAAKDGLLTKFGQCDGQKKWCEQLPGQALKKRSMSSSLPSPLLLTGMLMWWQEQVQLSCTQDIRCLLRVSASPYQGWNVYRLL